MVVVPGDFACAAHDQRLDRWMPALRQDYGSNCRVSVAVPDSPMPGNYVSGKAVSGKVPLTWLS